jgi:serine/threonine-protein kinase RsbW
MLGHGTGGGEMSRAATVFPDTRAFDGLPCEVRNARQFVGQAIDGYQAADDVILLSSELAANAVRHTASGSGGTFSVSVLAEAGRVRVEVHDLGSATAPAVKRLGAPGESGAGLGLVEAIADRWGFHGGRHGRVVWFEMDWQ